MESIKQKIVAEGEDKQEKDEINWSQVMAYFKGKLVELMGKFKPVSEAHHNAIMAASKLFEAQMACFVKAYRDQ